eukprot:6188087-Pleurochrysis_carterae.AAC.1
MFRLQRSTVLSITTSRVCRDGLLLAGARARRMHAPQLNVIRARFLRVCTSEVSWKVSRARAQETSL